MFKKSTLIFILISLGYVFLLVNIVIKLRNTKEVSFYKNDSTPTTSVNSPSPIPTPTIAGLPLTEIDNQNINTIKTYYRLLSQHKNKDAYEMYQTKTTTFDKYNEMYKNIISIAPKNFNKVSENNYKFDVILVDNQYQSETNSESKFWVNMKVISGKINTISTVEVFNEDRFDNLHAYSILKDNKNYLILSKNGQETIVDSANNQWEDADKYTGIFKSVSFSPQGDYLIYGFTGWEYYSKRVYDIKNQKKLENISADFSNIFKLSNNEKYLVICSGNEMSGMYNASVYSFPEFKPQFDFLKYSQYDYNRKCVNTEGEEMTFGCSYFDCEVDKDNKLVKFTVKSGDSVKPEYQQNIEVKFDLVSGSIIK